MVKNACRKYCHLLKNDCVPMQQTCTVNLTGLYEIFNSSSGRIVLVHAGFINDDPLQYLSSAKAHILQNHSAATYIL
jgi:hypothetical protein